MLQTQREYSDAELDNIKKADVFFGALTLVNLFK